MLKKINKNYILIFILTVLVLVLKYFYSFIFFKNDFLITKILLETSDVQYYPLVESLSRFDFSPSFNNYFIAKKIITFPLLSLIWHAILFKFFNYYSFIVLEFIFKLLIFIILYKIFKKVEINSKFAIFFSFLILALPSFFYLIGLLNFKSLDLINHLIDNNLGYRFPRPLVTFFYLNLFLYFLICFFQGNKKIKIVFILPLSIILIFLGNSFFYLFISCSLLLFIFLIIKLKKKFFLFIKKNILILFFSISLILIGLLIIFFQSFYGEADYSRRIGLFEINFQEKLYLLKYFLISLLKEEIIILIFFSLILNFYSKRILFKKYTTDVLSIFFYLFLSSIISPFLFVFLSSKVISLYHFFDLIIFTGIYYIFLSLIICCYYKFKNLFANSVFVYILIFACCFVIFLNNRFIAISASQRQDINLINSFLLKNNIKNTTEVLFTNDLRIINLWLYHKNKYLSVPEGFSNSLQDSQIERSLLLVFKSLNISDYDFEKFLYLKSKDGRNFFSTFFYNYKYQANSLKIFSNLNYYSDSDKHVILRTSPLRASANVVPEDEIQNILYKYKNIKREDKYLPDIIIINKDLFIKFNSKDFNKILDTKEFLVYKKI
jgi:hypothetical protein